MTAPDRYADWDAAYVLGALAPHERREFEVHKADCARCAAAVQELAGLPGMLAGVSRADAERSLAAVDASSGPVPPAVLTSLLGSARRRRLRRRLVAASIAVAAAVVLAVGVTGSSSRSHGPAAVQLTQLVAGPMHADVRFSAEPWGTRIEVDCSYAGESGTATSAPYPEPRSYALVVTDRAGQQMVAASWQPVAGATVSPTGSVGVPLKDIAQVQIRSSSGTPLLQLNR